VGLNITVQLLSGSYDAAEVGDRERPEWPPHPARLFCALVAAARGEDDRAALRWLEAQPAPHVVAAGQPQEGRHAAYVVTNVLSQKGGSQTHPGRTNGLRTRTRAVPATAWMRVEWPGDAGCERVAALDRMARRIPYLGRSTGIALVGASADGSPEGGAGSGPLDETLPDADALVRFEPCGLLDAEMSVRVPYPGFLGDLDAQFEAGRPAWEASRYHGYRRVAVVSPPEAGPPRAGSMSAPVPVPSVYEDVVVFRFAGLRPDARLAVRFTEALRRASLAVAGDDAPEALHGHGADGRPHVAFLALPDVGSQHADGHLLGLAVAVPHLPAPERQAVIRAVLGLRRPDLHEVVELGIPGLGKIELIYQPGLVRPWGAAPERWRKGSRRWISATPVVLDRHPKNPSKTEAEVLSCLRTVGLPEPAGLTISVEPLMPGAARLRPLDLPQRCHKKLFRHVAVTFDRVVNGPILVGAGRYLGVGLLAPVASGGNDA
jgi:CRISPR-associated protein Csb2